MSGITQFKFGDIVILPTDSKGVVVDVTLSGEVFVVPNYNKVFFKYSPSEISLA